MTIINKISRIGSVSETKYAKKLGKWFEKDPEGALAGVTVASIIAKDGVGCAMYVTQTMNNKRIPDDKRKFVAALDLTNGLLMILAQIGMFFAMRKYSGPIFNKLFSKSFNKIAKSNTISRIRMWTAKTGKAVAKKLGIEKVFDNKVQKNALDLFKFCADIAAATIVGKRVIVPLIATPAASKVEKWMDKREKRKKGISAPEDKSNPTMKGKAEPIQAVKVSNPAKVENNNETTNLLEKLAKK